MKPQRRGADRVAPDGGKPGQHRLRVAESAENAQRAAKKRDQDSLEQKQPPDARRREAQRQQRADLSQALFESKLEQQRHENQRREDEEEAEAEEQSAEILRLRTGRQRLRPHRFEAQPE